jgi:hypothetical protein
VTPGVQGEGMASDIVAPTALHVPLKSGYGALQLPFFRQHEVVPPSFGTGHGQLKSLMTIHATVAPDESVLCAQMAPPNCFARSRVGISLFMIEHVPESGGVGTHFEASAMYPHLPVESKPHTGV